MSENLVTIEAVVREQTGKEYARKLRKAGKIPANLMEKGKATSLELDPKWLGKAYKEGKKFNLTLNGETKLVVIKEVHLDAIKRMPLHVDLMYA
ncbi:hypothetical protein [Pseudobacteriovorax antillogorgiicola]|uniref:50S ribosomal protein L25 n=1 Tax=Pseudobacteriovorax antillogorgiicola TaxID=1513793 RepID=A0A1Y6B8F1_9BACT|nr:hypothetical protein [Pseudobacteriovorax antillogorgiicola]TCS59281.1 ribosomal protein L25 (general stress protein Ctc) [Pseudobacteriovorax antillogorgiicola]SME89784.1 Ribosomal protein L25 (general stress protein Ctc) [Pseudobacteriovorax antillogorgiicola]